MLLTEKTEILEKKRARVPNNRCFRGFIMCLFHIYIFYVFYLNVAVLSFTELHTCKDMSCSIIFIYLCNMYLLGQCGD